MIKEIEESVQTIFEIQAVAKNDGLILHTNHQTYEEMCASANDWYLSCDAPLIGILIDGEYPCFSFRIEELSDLIWNKLKTKGFHFHKEDGYAWKYFFGNKKKATYQIGKKEEFVKEAIEGLQIIKNILSSI